MLGLGNSLSRGGVLSAGFTNSYSLSFDGSDDTFQTADFESVLQSSFTVSLWYKPDDGIPGSTEAVCGMVNNDAVTWCYIYHLADGKFKAYYKEGTASVVATTSTAQADGAGSWIHIAYTMTEGGTESLQIYLNGSPDGSAGTAPLDMDSFDAGGKKFNFGSRNDNGVVDKVAAGLIDECAIWNTALSANDISSIYNSGVPNDLNDSASYDTDRTGNLQGWWRSEEGTGASIADSSPNSNTGTLSNGVAFSADVPS